MPRKILIIDDDKCIIEITRVVLEINGYEVLNAFDGEEAMAKVRHEIPDLIMLDLLMPKMDGWEVYNQLKEYSKTAHIPIILVSALDKDTQMNKEMDVEGYLEKPFEINELIEKINNVLDSKRE
ncbi:MAG: response regulator [bacterium]|nr:response regulator [bacterium]